MKTKILKALKELEEKDNIKILFAVESGSRSWNFHSNDSDYDVRCVHISPVANYFSIDEPPEQISLHGEHFKDGQKVKEDTIDIVSWDIKKFCKLFYKSNSTVNEWLNSDIIYIDNEYRNQLKELFQKDFSREFIINHYISMARQNYEKYIRNHNPCSLKKYVYILRAIGCIEWLEQRKTIPPIKYNDLLIVMPEKLKTFFEECVKLKQSSEECDGPQNEEINRIIESYFDKKYDNFPNNFDKKVIDRMLRTIITLQGK